MTGTWVGPGSAAVILVGQVEGNLLKSGRFRPDNTIIATLYYCDLDLFVNFRAPNLLKNEVDCSGFSGPATKRYCHSIY